MLPATIPMQLTFAALGETALGYDSTAPDPRTGAYVDSPLFQIGVDAQAMLETPRTRQVLRNRVEAVYEPTGGRDPLDSDFFEVVRYGLVWQPGDTLTFHTDGTYAIGSPALFFSRAGRPDVSFARRGLAYPHQIVADYALRQDAVFQPTDGDQIQVEATVAGRYRVTPQPAGQNMFTPNATAQWLREFDEDNQGVLGVHGEYLNLELFRPVWMTQAFVGWSHRFDDSFQFFVEGGATLVEENLGTDQLDAQPFFRGRVFKRFERQRLLLGASYTHTFGLVSATLGTGALDVVALSAWWMPGSPRWLLFSDLGFQHGQGYDPTTLVPIDATYASAVAGARFAITPAFRVFARYEFQWETDSNFTATGSPDFIRHVAMLGLEVAFGTDPLAVEQMLPIDELQALEHTEFSETANVPLSSTSGFVGDEANPRHQRTDDSFDADPMSHDPWSHQSLPGSSEPNVPGAEPDEQPNNRVDPDHHEDAR